MIQLWGKKKQHLFCILGGAHFKKQSFLIFIYLPLAEHTACGRSRARDRTCTLLAKPVPQLRQRHILKPLHPMGTSLGAYSRCLANRPSASGTFKDKRHSHRMGGWALREETPQKRSHWNRGYRFWLQCRENAFNTIFLLSVTFIGQLDVLRPTLSCNYRIKKFLTEADNWRSHAIFSLWW